MRAILFAVALAACLGGCGEKEPELDARRACEDMQNAECEYVYACPQEAPQSSIDWCGLPGIAPRSSPPVQCGVDDGALYCSSSTMANGTSAEAFAACEAAYLAAASGSCPSSIPECDAVDFCAP